MNTNTIASLALALTANKPNPTMDALCLAIGSFAHTLAAIRRAWTAESANPKAVFTYLASPMAQAASYSSGVLRYALIAALTQFRSLPKRHPDRIKAAQRIRAGRSAARR